MIDHSREWWIDELRWGARHPWLFTKSWTWPVRHPQQWLMAQEWHYTAGARYPHLTPMPWYVRKFAEWNDQRWKKHYG